MSHELDISDSFVSGSIVRGENNFGRITEVRVRHCCRGNAPKNRGCLEGRLHVDDPNFKRMLPKEATRKDEPDLEISQLSVFKAVSSGQSGTTGQISLVVELLRAEIIQ